MHVRKRNGGLEPVNLNKIVASLERYCGDLPTVDVYRIATKTVGGLIEGVSTRELDMFSVRTAKDLIIDDPVYSRVAARILANLIQKEVSGQDIQSFSQSIEAGFAQGLIAPETHALVMANKRKLNAAIKHERDWSIEYHGLQTVYDRYLLKHRTLIALEESGQKQRAVIETPQYFFLRVACGLADDAGEAIELYNLLSSLEYMCSTPTLFNSGTVHSQMSSCFVAGTEVMTVNAGVKRIEDVAIGDQVVTHRGQVRPVTQLHRNPLGDRILFDIKCFGSPRLTVTGNHRFWSISEEQIEWGVTAPTLNPIDYLRTGDWIAIPGWAGDVTEETIDIASLLHLFPGNGGRSSYRYEVSEATIDIVSHWTREDHLNHNPNGIAMSKAHESLKRILRMDDNLAQFLGIWYGDGHVNRHRDSFGNQVIDGIGITAHKDNVGLIEFCQMVGRECFGLEAGVYPFKDQNCVKIVFASPLLGNVFNHLFGAYCDGKRLHSGCYRWTRSLFDSLITGLISTDGCVTVDGHIILALANPGLIKSIYMVARNLGIPITCRSVKNKKDPNYLVQWALNFPVTPDILARVQKTYLDDRLLANKRGQSTCVKHIDGVTFVRLNKKTISTQQDEFVYTLGVEDDHSYSVEGLLCENCYLNDSPLDSLDDIYKRYSDIALLSKFAGGIGVSLSRIRSKGSLIRGTNGNSNGLVPWAHTLSASVGTVNQGGKRRGAACIYLETHHPDLIQFLELRDNTGEKEQRAYNLNLANWVSDLFMQRVKDDAMWSFFDPTIAPELADLYGDAYERRYRHLEAEGKYTEQMPARKVYSRMMRTLAETGNGWMTFKDAANRRGNQVNDEAGTVIHLSNLCVAPETMILTDRGEVPIGTLRDQVVSVWNGHQFSPVIVRLTGFDKPLLHIVFDNGKTLDCTSYHKFFVCAEIGTYERRAMELQPGDRLLCVAEDTSQSFVHVVEVQDNYRRDDTYCFLEAQHHMAVFNGILAGNCTEILEVTSSGTRQLMSREEMAQTSAADLMEQNVRVVGFDTKHDAFEVIKGSECAVCLVKGTQVLTQEGYKAIERCQGGAVYVPFVSDVDFTRKPRFIKADLIDNGIRDCLEITLGDGKRLRVTGNHKILVRTSRDRYAKRDSYKWITADRIVPGDAIVSSRNETVYHRFDYDPEFAALGWMVGDGWCLEDGTVGLCFAPEKIACQQTVMEIVEEWHQALPIAVGAPNDVFPASHTQPNGVVNWATQKRSFFTMLQGKFGMNPAKSPHKEVPASVLAGTAAQKASFLSGLFSADGSIIRKKNTANGIALSSSSRLLLEQVQTLLAEFGIHMGLTWFYVAERDRWQGALRSEDKMSIKAFETIGFRLHPVKQADLDSIMGKRTIDRGYVKVRAVKPIGPHQVYDLYVPGAHHFVAEGTISHNCNLGSINVGRGYVKHGRFDKEKLRRNVAIAVKYLDRVIDRNFYPIHEAQASNHRWRPIGLGLMGIADLFFQLHLPFESEQAIRLSGEIQEEIYYQALRTSCDLAQSLGQHRDFHLTRAAKGQLQFDLAGVEPSDPDRWNALRQEIMQHGLRNSLLIAIAPTATISHICGVEECIEAIKSNLLKRETLSGEFIAINKYLVEDLRKLDRWNAETITQLKVNEGSIANIPDLPIEMYETYKTVWEMSMKSVIAHAVVRGAYIDQSHSLNMFIDLNRYPEDKRIGVLSSLYMHAWESGLKTTYYFRSRAATRIEQTTTRAYTAAVAAENPEVCESCQ